MKLANLGYRNIIPLLAILFLTLYKMAFAAPQNNKGTSAVLYDDTTGKSYDHSSVAVHLNQRLTTVPRLDLISGNEAPVMEERKLFDDYEEPAAPPAPPAWSMGPWMKYKQTYYNPYSYGGRYRGAPTWVPEFGLWPKY